MLSRITYTNHIIDVKLAKEYHDFAFKEFGGEALFVALAEQEEKNKQE